MAAAASASESTATALHATSADGPAASAAVPAHLADSPFDPLTSTTRPLEDAIITVRVIKSFEYRTHKALVLRGVDLTTTTVEALVKRCNDEIKTAAGFKPYRTLKFGEESKAPKGAAAGTTADEGNA